MALRLYTLVGFYGFVRLLPYKLYSHPNTPTGMPHSASTWEASRHTTATSSPERIASMHRREWNHGDPGHREHQQPSQPVFVTHHQHHQHHHLRAQSPTYSKSGGTSHNPSPIAATSPPRRSGGGGGVPAPMLLPHASSGGRGFQQLQEAIAWFVARRADATRHSGHGNTTTSTTTPAGAKVDTSGSPIPSSPRPPAAAAADDGHVDPVLATLGVDGAFLMLAKFIRTFFARQDSLRHFVKPLDATMPGEGNGPESSRGDVSDIHRAFEVVATCCGVVLQQVLSVAGTMTEASTSLHTIQSALEVVGHHVFVEPLVSSAQQQQQQQGSGPSSFDNDPLGRKSRKRSEATSSSSSHITRIQKELDRHFGREQRLQRYRALQEHNKRNNPGTSSESDDHGGVATDGADGDHHSSSSGGFSSVGSQRSSSVLSSLHGGDGSGAGGLRSSSFHVAASRKRSAARLPSQVTKLPPSQRATLPEVLGLPSSTNGLTTKNINAVASPGVAQRPPPPPSRTQVQTSIASVLDESHYDDPAKVAAASVALRRSLQPLVPLVAVLSADPMCHLPAAFAELEATQMRHRVVSLWERTRASRWEFHVLRNTFTAWRGVARYEANQHNTIADLQRNLAHARQTADEKIRLSKQAQARLTELQSHTDRDRQEMLRERELEKQDFYVLRVKVTEQAEEIEALNQRIDHLEAKRVFLASELQRKDAKLQQYFHQSRKAQHSSGGGPAANAHPGSTAPSVTPLASSILSPLSTSHNSTHHQQHVFHYCQPEQLEYDPADDAEDAGPLVEEMLEMVEEFADAIAPIPKKCYTFRNVGGSVRLGEDGEPLGDDELLDEESDDLHHRGRGGDSSSNVSVTVDTFEDLVTMLIQQQRQRVRAVAEAQLHLSEYSGAAAGGGLSARTPSRGPTPTQSFEITATAGGGGAGGNSSGGEEMASSRMHSAIGKYPSAGPLHLDGEGLQEGEQSKPSAREARSPDPTQQPQPPARRASTVTSKASRLSRQAPQPFASTVRSSSRPLHRKRSLSNASSMATPGGTSLAPPGGGRAVDAEVQKSIVGALVIDSHQYAPQWLQMLCYMLSQQQQHLGISSSYSQAQLQPHGPVATVHLLNVSARSAESGASVTAPDAPAVSGGGDVLARSDTIAPQVGAGEEGDDPCRNNKSLLMSVDATTTDADRRVDGIIAASMGDVRSVVATLWKSSAYANHHAFRSVDPLGTNPGISGAGHQTQHKGRATPTSTASRTPHPPARSSSSHSNANHPHHAHHHHHSGGGSSGAGVGPSMADVVQLLGDALSSTRVFCLPSERMATSTSAASVPAAAARGTVAKPTTKSSPQEQQQQDEQGEGLPSFCAPRDEPSRLATLRRRIREAWLRGSSAERLLKFLALEFMNADRKDKLSEDTQLLRRMEASNMSTVSSMATPRLGPGTSRQPGGVGGARRTFGSLSRRASTVLQDSSDGGAEKDDLAPPSAGVLTRRSSAVAVAALARRTSTAASRKK